MRLLNSFTVVCLILAVRTVLASEPLQLLKCRENSAKPNLGFVVSTTSELQTDPVSIRLNLDIDDLLTGFPIGGSIKAYELNSMVQIRDFFLEFKQGQRSMKLKVSGSPLTGELILVHASQTIPVACELARSN